VVEISPALRDFLKTPVFEDLEDEQRQMQAIHRFYFLRALGPEIRKQNKRKEWQSICNLGPFLFTDSLTWFHFYFIHPVTNISSRSFGEHDAS
jgi:hypothetical protein